MVFVPPVYRSMLKDGEKPIIGSESNMLGVRPSDISVDVMDCVHPSTGGLSVFEDWRKMPPMLIPERLRPKRLGARGSNDCAVFRFKAIEFESGPIADGLSLAWGKKYHGTIEPITSTTVTSYQTSLADTCEDWFIAEYE